MAPPLTATKLSEDLAEIAAVGYPRRLFGPFVPGKTEKTKTTIARTKPIMKKMPAVPMLAMLKGFTPGLAPKMIAGTISTAPMQ